MSSFRARRDLTAALIVNAVLWSTGLFAQSQPSPTPPDQPSRVSTMYVPPENSAFQEVYDILRQRGALGRIQEILSPLRSRRAHHQDDRMQGGEFVVQARKLQTNCDDL